MELWDAYDAGFHQLEGKFLIRGEPIPDGLFHLVCDILVKHTDGTFLLMKRDPRKHCGGMWEATAGGSALAGETPLACALRELREETGIAASRLTRLGHTVSRDTRAIYVEFLCITGREKNAVSLQAGETSAYKWVTREELERMRKDELVTERMQQYLNSGRA